MTVYWLLFSYFALGMLFNYRSRPAVPAGGATQRAVPKVRGEPLLAVGIVAVALLIGLRYEVGADWDSYEFMFDWARYRELSDALSVGDPGYQFLNWSVQALEGQLWVVNLVCALIFGWGLFNFARVQPDPWTAVMIAVPYLIVVVAMGYSRQAVAIGILMAGLAALSRGANLLRFTLYVAAAALFHKTAVVALPLVILAGQRNRMLNFIVGVAAFVLLYDVFLSDSMEEFVDRYIDAAYSSEGAAIRVAMNLLPAGLFLIYRKRLAFSDQEHAIWRNFSVAAWAMVVLLAVLPSSTAVDRISLYIMPLQIAVLSHIPGRIMRVAAGRAAILIYSFAVLFVWLNYATHAQFWLPYRFFPM